jgi:Cu/Ag efflux protein CusF
MLTKQLADYKLYVLNNLVQIVHDTESNQKEKIAALRSIGEIDGVDAFKKKTEITHKHETMEEVETELLAMLSELKQKAVLKPKSQTVDAEFTMSKKDIDDLQEEVKEYVGEYKVESDGREETENN